jgi:hypothetical protein
VTSTGLDIVDADGDSICETLTVISYGVIECMTKTEEIAADTQLSIVQDDETYACVSTDTTVCNYEQLTDAGFPAVASTAVDGNTIVFTGTDFDFSSEYSPLASFAGIQADSVVVDSATQATATYTLGVPWVIEDGFATLSFLKDDGTTEQVFAVSEAAMANDVSVTASTSGL